MTTHHDQYSINNPSDIYQRYNDAQNSGDLLLLEELLDENLTVRVNGKPSLSSVEDDRRALDALYSAYPDYRRELIDVFDVDDRAVAQWRMLGTPANPGIALLDVPGCSIVTMRNGRIAEADLYYEGEALNRVMLAPRDVDD